MNDLDTLCDGARAVILDAARKRMETPTSLEIAQAIGTSSRSMTLILKHLHNQGRVNVVRYENNQNIIHYFEIADRGQTLATVQRQPNTRPMAGRYNDHGGGPIARMFDRTKAENLILAVYRGELSEADAQDMARTPSKVAA